MPKLRRKIFNRTEPQPWEYWEGFGWVDQQTVIDYFDKAITKHDEAACLKMRAFDRYHGSGKNKWNLLSINGKYPMVNKPSK